MIELIRTERAVCLPLPQSSEDKEAGRIYRCGVCLRRSPWSGSSHTIAVPALLHVERAGYTDFSFVSFVLPTVRCAKGMPALAARIFAMRDEKQHDIFESGCVSDLKVS